MKKGFIFGLSSVMFLVIVGVIVVGGLLFMNQNNRIECFPNSEVIVCTDGMFCSQSERVCMTLQECENNGEPSIADNVCFLGV